MTTISATAYLTRVQLNPRSREAARDLTDVQNLHRRAMSLIPDQLGSAETRQASGLLYRLERTPRAHTLLLQSYAPLDLDALPVGYALATDDRDLTRLLHWLAPGRTVRYRIDAQPYRSLPSPVDDRDTEGRRKRGTKIHIFGDDAITWWHRKATQAGLTTTSGVLATQQPDVTGWKDDPRETGKRIHIYGKRTRFEGTATITDPDALRTAILQGVGRNRAYGAGLLSIAPLNHT
ncbi:type I-E CRISPR-associated protein Cas6/Cse3/CasE [Streptomyces sp. WAC08241]|uniref:type I-E CRISPR-associated protein Cas6/Cse3/CasE n=1 Tax=Streptomyces sp. WAC08241 TaxID=2487421 RepID=UPI000F78A27E|nr:type I-E CRISPR-associated protein Cas6/Cse3/CasE [Streptomyces sp. WAC08241]RSS32573.1 type I-E CRISPR-associated protein Cas6/Cse3/CasE [Streptomyces sp. WAC08241]